MARPRRREVTSINSILAIATPQLIPDKSIMNAANKIGEKAIIAPNRMAPEIFANTRVVILIGASNKRSKERPLLSKVIVTASIDVVPNRMLIAIKPGNSDLISIA